MNVKRVDLNPGYVTVGYIFFETVAYLFLSLSTVITALLESVASVRLSGRPWIWVATNPFTSAVLLIKRQTPQLSGFPLIDLEREWV